MTFKESVRTCLTERYVGFSGRAPRSEFWWFALFVLAGQFVLGALDGLVFPGDTAVLNPLFSLAVFLPQIAVAVRRLHDTGRSGWWLLLALIPVIGFLILVWWYTRPTEPGPNRFGPPPRRTPLQAPQ